MARASSPATAAGLLAGGHALAGPRSSSRAHSSAVPRITGPQPRIPAATAPCSEPGIGGQRHPRGDVGRHHPVLGDRDQQQVEEEALLLGRLLAGEQQVEVLGEAEPAHQVAAEVASAHLDPVGVGLADVGDRGSGLADLHACAPSAVVWPAQPDTVQVWGSRN